MKNFKKLIKESYLGNPLNENSIDENLMAKFQDALDDDQFDFFQRALDKAERGEELNQSEEQVVKYFGMVKAKYDDAIAQGMSPDEITLNPNKPINEIESGDIVVYNHDDHTVMRIDDDGKIYIRPNEESAILGKRDTFWVKPTDIETKEEFMDRMMKDQIEHDEETLRRERGLEETAGTFGDGVTDETKEKYNKASMDKFGKPFAKLNLDQKQEVTSTIIEPKLKDILSKSSSLIGRQGTRNFMDEAEDKVNEVVRGDDFQFIEIKDLHFETDPDRLEDMKIAFGAKMGGITNREKIEDAEYELRRFRKSISFGDGSYSGVFLPGTYDAINSKLGDGPHTKKVPTPKWNEKKYEQWIEDIASGGGAEFAYDMAQNAKMEAGLIDWVKKNRLGFGDVTPLERIQYDIEALAESVNEVTQKEIDDIEDSGNIDMAYKKAMKLLNSLKDKEDESVNEGTCGYTPDGKPRSKPASPELREDDINLNIDDKGKESEDLDNEVNHMFESAVATFNKAMKPVDDMIRDNKKELEASNDILQAIAKMLGKSMEEDLDENLINKTKQLLQKIFGPKLDDDIVTILADEIKMILDKNPKLKDDPKKDIKIAQELVKDSDIFKDKDYKKLMKPRMGFIGEEEKEFNFNKMVKEALTPNYLK